MSQNTTQYGTIDQCDPDMQNQHKKTQKTQNTGKMVLGEGDLELPIPGEPGKWIIPLRESGIQFPGTRIIPLRESEIQYKTEPTASGREG